MTVLVSPGQGSQWAGRPWIDNSFYGLAIGFTVAAGAVAVGGISGGAFTPAVAVSGVAMGMFSGSMIWMFVAAQAIAGAAAGFAFRALNPADK